MKHRFNRQAATWTFVAIVLAFAITAAISRWNNQPVSLVGSLVYGILGLFASIITGLVVPKKKIKSEKFTDNDLNENENENERRKN